MSEEYKALVRRLVEEVQNKHNLDALDEILAPNFVNRSAPAGAPADRGATRKIMTEMLAAIPDLKSTIHDMLAEGDKVMTRKTLSGTLQGELMGVAPTGQPVTIEVIDILRIEGGQAVEHWVVSDRSGVRP